MSTTAFTLQLIRRPDLTPLFGTEPNDVVTVIFKSIDAANSFIATQGKTANWTSVERNASSVHDWLVNRKTKDNVIWVVSNPTTDITAGQMPIDTAIATWNMIRTAET